eukprot:6213145-Pleurochrysis_carterae.AAC.1
MPPGEWSPASLLPWCNIIPEQQLDGVAWWGKSVLRARWLASECCAYQQALDFVARNTAQG